MQSQPKFTSEILYQRLVFKLPKTVYNTEYGHQLIRSSASPGANYIEAIEASSRKAFTHKLKVCRIEIKESIHWLVLIESSNTDISWTQNECQQLIGEARELIRIFTSSILTTEKNQGIKK